MLHSCCTHTLLILFSYSSHTLLILFSCCTHTLLILFSYSSHTLLILQVLSKSKHITLETIDSFMRERLEEEDEGIEDDEQEITRYRSDIKSMRAEIEAAQKVQEKSSKGTEDTSYIHDLGLGSNLGQYRDINDIPKINILCVRKSSSDCSRFDASSGSSGSSPEASDIRSATFCSPEHRSV
jgi:hypothetical protein